MVDDQPEWRTGKICYIEIPAAEVARSAEFYQPGLAEAEEKNQHD
jgi:hypothetical protein